MAIYEFTCNKCGGEAEMSLPMQTCNRTFICSCGGELRRRFSVPAISMKVYGNNMVTDTLNREYNTLPPKQVELLAGGLKPFERSLF